MFMCTEVMRWFYCSIRITIFSTISTRLDIFFTRLLTLFQLVVERMLASEGIKRADLGRDEFTKRVWEWKEKYSTHSSISDQVFQNMTGHQFLIRIYCVFNYQQIRRYINIVSDMVLFFFTMELQVLASCSIYDYYLCSQKLKIYV